MQARYYDPVIGRFYSNDPIGYTGKNPVMSFNRYIYVNNNLYKYNDPDGRELQAITMKGLTSSDPVLKERTYYVDKKIATNVKTFVSQVTAKYPKLSVNNTFRVKPSSTIKTTNTKAKELSRHQGGFAVDLNGTGTLKNSELADVRKIAGENGLTPALAPDKDKPHFSANPKDHGYKSLKESVEVNKKDYEDKT